jgi:hypothetical protein
MKPDATDPVRNLRGRGIRGPPSHECLLFLRREDDPLVGVRCPRAELVRTELLHQREAAAVEEPPQFVGREELQPQAVVVFLDLLAALREQGLVDAQIPRDVVVLRAPLLPDRDARIGRRAQRGERPTGKGPGTIGCVNARPDPPPPREVLLVAMIRPTLRFQRLTCRRGWTLPLEISSPDMRARQRASPEAPRIRRGATSGCAPGDAVPGQHPWSCTE